MSKSNDTERTRELTKAELDAVSGGWLSHENTTITGAATTTHSRFWWVVDGGLKEAGP